MSFTKFWEPVVNPPKGCHRLLLHYENTRLKFVTFLRSRIRCGLNYSGAKMGIKIGELYAMTSIEKYNIINTELSLGQTMTP